MMGQSVEAQGAYRQVLAHDPNNVRVLVSLAKLLLGLGLNNYAALNACALNLDEALPLLQRAERLVNEQQQRERDPALAELRSSVREILQFCEQEHAEAAQWTAVVSSLKLERKQRGGELPPPPEANKEAASASAPGGAAAAAAAAAVRREGEEGRVRGYLVRLYKWWMHWGRQLRMVLGLGLGLLGLPLPANNPHERSPRPSMTTEESYPSPSSKL